MPLVQLTDFPDRLSPMLVKELRQGMRARGFTLLFLIFQCLLALILLMTGSAMDSDNAGSAASSVIFTMFTIAVLVVQPMRGMSALSSEISGNTIEMMALTRLNASRIVLGKWVAIVSQSALILTSIIPYLILRYFYGGMVLLGEMTALALVFLTSMALTAVTVGLSAFASKLLRGLFIAGIILSSQALRFMIFSGRSSGPSMSSFVLSDWQSVAATGAYITFIAYVGCCAISQGTAAIAPAAENHSTLRRLIALGLMLVYALISVFSKMDFGLSLAVFAIILTPAILAALTEPLVLLPPIFKPFIKRGIIGKIASYVLLPGWPTGVFFMIAILAIGFIGIVLGRWDHLALVSPAHFLSSIFDSRTEFTVMLSLLGGVLLAALLAAFFTKVESRRFILFILLLLALGAIALLVGILANVNHHEAFLWLFIWDPLVFLGMVDNSGFDKSGMLLASAVIDAAILTVLVGVALRKFRYYRQIMKEAETELTNEAAKAASS